MSIPLERAAATLADPHQHTTPIARQPDDECWRCNRKCDPKGIGLCTGCLAWLHDESDDDPAEEPVISAPVGTAWASFMGWPMGGAAR